MKRVLGFRWGFLAVLALTAASAASATPLDDYVYTPDPVYQWQLAATYDREGYTEYVLDLHSQEWLTAAEVDRPLWEHWLIITKPDDAEFSTGMLFIGGGGNGRPVPTEGDSMLTQIALLTKSVVAELKQVPNQRLTFTGYRSETEDGLIAYGWARFFETGDPKWLMRLPMTKAAVRAMDAMTEFLSTGPGGQYTLDKYVVSGASKRGWTTWTTAAVDPRVVACAPLVIDLLNMDISFRHHYDSLGYWSRQINDYTENGITDWFGTPEMQDLLYVVEPYSYRHRLTMPKFIMNGSQDDFFLPDSSQFYFNKLEGEKRLLYVANADHGLEQPQAIPALVTWYWSILNNVPRPNVSSYKKHDGTLVIDTQGGTPTQILLWQATNPNERVFMYDEVPGIYTASPITPSPTGHYEVSVSPPATGWTAFFVEFQFNSGGPFPFIFSSQISIVPDVLPYGPHYTQSGAAELLNAAFYNEGSATNTAVRHAVGGVASNDGQKVAFWGVNTQTQAAGLYVVNAGRPASWRRIAPDLPAMPAAPILWTPDDSALIVGQTIVTLPAPGQVSAYSPYVIHGNPTDVYAMTARASGNWAFTYDGGRILGLPVLPNGGDDFSRQLTLVTDLTDAGVSIGQIGVAADGSALAFSDTHAGAGQSADSGNVYALKNLQTILGAAKRPGTRFSALAPTSLQDDNIFAIRTVESDNYAGFPFVSDDGSLVYFFEDQLNKYKAGTPLNTLATAATDFDLMVSYSDGTEADQQLALEGSPLFPSLVHGGSRFVYSQTSGGVLRLYADSLRTTTAVSDRVIPYAWLTVPARQQFESDGGAVVDMPQGTAVTYPNGTAKEIRIETPTAPDAYGRAPAGTGGIPVVRTIGSENITFGQPVTLTIAYNDAEIRGLDESRLDVYRYDSTAKGFVKVSGTPVRDSVNNTITVSVTRLGAYGVAGPGVQDSDGDGLSNQWEGQYGFDPFTPTDPNNDNDGDGLTNLQEYEAGTAPIMEDTDGDGVWDAVEVRAGSNPNNGSVVPGAPINGDVDWNGQRNALDVQLGINGALGKPTPCRTDINGDGRTDAFDVQVIINSVLGRVG